MPAPIYGPEGASIFIPTGPAPDYTQFLENDPFYKQNITDINTAQQRAAARALEDQAFMSRSYDLNVAQASAAASGGGDYGLAAAQRNAALQKEGLARENANKAEYLREWLGGRGMVDSGQNAWEQGEREFQFGLANRGIDSDLQGRAEAAAAARAEAQSRLSMQLQELSLSRERSQLEFSRDAEDRDFNAARARGDAAFDLYQRLSASGKLNAPGEMAIWDEESQLYVTKDGRYFDAFGTATSYQRQQAQQAAQQSSSSYVPGSGQITEYPVSRGGAYDQPYGSNPIPGTWGYA